MEWYVHYTVIVHVSLRKSGRRAISRYTIVCIYLCSSAKQNTVVLYSRVHISSDTAFFKILKKPSIVQK